VIDVGLPSDLFLGGLDIGGGLFVLLGEVLVILPAFGKLDLNIPE